MSHLRSTLNRNGTSLVRMTNDTVDKVYNRLLDDKKALDYESLPTFPE
ncbi:MAG: hypothetical protein V2I33_21915 [Kangiellaceae bacterium]|nr:hypothetical protein [Kangiellaceae bacterium]